MPQMFGTYAGESGQRHQLCLWCWPRRQPTQDFNQIVRIREPVHDPGPSGTGKMTEHQALSSLKRELDDDDKIHISEIFQGDIAARLMQMDARSGNISCEFAGPQYRYWVIEFKSSRWGLEIVDFEYDEDTRSFNLPSPITLLEHP